MYWQEWYEIKWKGFSVGHTCQAWFTLYDPGTKKAGGGKILDTRGRIKGLKIDYWGFNEKSEEKIIVIHRDIVGTKQWYLQYFFVPQQCT